jgi:phosphate/sulfate permease
MVGSCGCFGHEDTPPHPVHVVLDLILGGVAVTAAAQGLVPAEEIADAPGPGAVVVGLSAVALWLVYAAFVHLPRASQRRQDG